MSSREEVESRHKKELKALEGEKRAALKKAKALKGKKGKEAIERYVNTFNPLTRTKYSRKAHVNLFLNVLVRKKNLMKSYKR